MAHNVNQLLKELENEMSKSSSKKPLEEEEAAKQQQPRALRTDVAHTPTPCATPVSGAVSRTSDQKHSDSTALLVKSMLPPYQSLDQTVPYSMSRQQMQQAKEGSSQSVPAQIHAVREYLGVATDQRNQQAAQEGELLKQQLQAAALNEQQQREFLKQQHLAQKETLAQVAGQHMQQQETRRVYEQQQQQEETRRMYEQQQQEETRRMYEQQQQQAAREQEYFKQQLAHKESQMHNEREYLNQQLLLQQQHQHHQQHALSVHIQAEREHMRQLQQQQPKENLTREIEIVKPRGTPLGASFTLSGLLLAVLPGSPGYHAGLSSLIGQRVTHINGRQLSSYDVIKESDRLVLRGGCEKEKKKMWFAAPVVVGAALTDLRKVPYVGKYLEQWSLAEKFRKMRYVLYAVCIVLVLVVVRFVLDLLRDILLWRAKSVAEKWFLKVKDSSGGGLQGMTLPVAYTSKALLNTISCNLGRNGESDISRIFIGYDRVEIPPLALSDTLVTLQGNGCNNLIEVQFKKGGVYGGNKPACTATSYITYIMLLVVVMCCGAVCVWAFFVGRRTPSRSTAKPVVVNTVRERKKVEHHTPPQTSCYVMHNAWASKGWTKQSIAMSMSEEGVRISTVSNKNTPSVLYDLSEAVVNEILFASPAGENGKTMLVTSPSKGFMIQFPSENEHVSWLAAVKSVAKFVFTLREFLQVKLKAAPGECVSTLSVSATLCVDIAQKSITVCNDETVVAQISMNNLQYAVHNGVVHLRSSSLGCSGFSFIPPDRSIDRWVEILREHAVLYDPPKHDIQGLMYVTPKGGARKLSLVSFCSVKMELTHAACPVGVGGHVAWPFVRSWLSSARPVTLSFTAVSQSSQSGFTVHTVPVGHHADPCVQEHFDAWNKRFSQTKLSSPPVFSRLMDSPTADRGILEKWGIK